MQRRHIQFKWLILAIVFTLVTIGAGIVALDAGVLGGTGDGPDYGAAERYERARWYLPALAILFGLTSMSWLGVFNKHRPIPLLLTVVGTAALVGVAVISTPTVPGMDVHIYRCTERFDPAQEARGDRCTLWLGEPVSFHLVVSDRMEGNKRIADEMTQTGSIEIDDLPAGSFQASVVISAGDSVSSVALVDADSSDMITWLTPRSSVSSVEWANTIEMTGEPQNIDILLFEGTDPRLENATVKYDVFSCEGQTTETFNPAACGQNTTVDLEFRDSTPADHSRTWRTINYVQRADGIEMVPLDQHMYRLVPWFDSGYYTNAHYEVVVLPDQSVNPDESLMETNPDTGESEWVLEPTEDNTVIEVDVYIVPKAAD